MTGTDFTTLTDLASRALGGSVSAANDELFAQRENLIKPDAPLFDPADFGHKERCTTGGRLGVVVTKAVTTGRSCDWAPRASCTASSSTPLTSPVTTRRSSPWRRRRSTAIPPSRMCRMRSGTVSSTSPRSR